MADKWKFELYPPKDMSKLLYLKMFGNLPTREDFEGEPDDEDTSNVRWLTNQP